MSPLKPGILARGPWELDAIEARWQQETYDPGAAGTAAADAAITALLDRGSPAHDGIGARLVDHAPTAGGLRLEIQPIRWALRLVVDDASQSIAALCVTRSANGRWLAGRRSAWLSTWPGRWALGAGGAVDAGENPAATLTRELDEEWSVAPERISAEALICLPHQLVMFVGMAWLPDGAEVVPDSEHDAHAWWPADVDRWPAEADDALRRMASLLDRGD
ncbi:MAG TPA: NUDIX domain-containing protein [Solirubrobacteraceae bacterium]|nr:NUDIX domain-containing protein [Solirubrobacteraceae bacterium]